MDFWTNKWFRRRLLIVVGFNLALFLTPSFWSCTNPPPQEKQKEEKTTIKDSSVEVVPEVKTDKAMPAEVTPDADASVPEVQEKIAEKTPQESGPDWHKPNTPWKSDGSKPKDSEDFELRMPSVKVAASSERIHCVVGVMKSKFVRMLHKFEPLFDNKEMVKRIWVSQDDGQKTGDWDCTTGPMDKDTKLLFVWEPGMPAFQFPEKSGIRVEAATRIRIAVLYKNDTKSDVTDSSGLKINHILATGNKWKLFSQFATGITLEPGAVTQASLGCPAKNRYSMLAVSPHLHNHGTSFISELIRKDGSREELIFLSNFDAGKHLRMYKAPFTMQTGDKLVTTCAWHNKSKGIIKGGFMTNDAACGLLLYVEGDADDELCGKDDNGGNSNYKPPPLKYRKGRCVAKTSLKTTKTIKVKTTIGTLPSKLALKGGSFVDGNYMLTNMQAIFKPSLISTFLEKDYTQAAGQINIVKGKLHIDLVVQAIADYGGRLLPYKLPLSVNGTLVSTKVPNEYGFKFTCGKLDDVRFAYEVQGDTLKLEVIQAITSSFGVLEFYLNLSFTKQK